MSLQITRRSFLRVAGAGALAVGGLGKPGEALAQAFAQMVWTATEPEAGGYTQVRFLVDGRPTTVIDGDGFEQDVVMRRDYSELAPLR